MKRPDEQATVFGNGFTPGRALIRQRDARRTLPLIVTTPPFAFTDLGLTANDTTEARRPPAAATPEASPRLTCRCLAGPTAVSDGDPFVAGVGAGTAV